MNLLPAGTLVDLTTCDREPIHTPGQIQAHGVLLVLERATLRVTQVSDNASDLLGRAPATLLGAELASLLAPVDCERLRAACADGGLDDAPRHILRGSVCGVGPFDLIAHTRGPIALVELEPADATAAVPDFYDFASHALAGLVGNPTASTYCRALAAAVRELTGYDRVMVYRFEPDWSGHVVAEELSAGQLPYLDLHYPASDIPAQARALFLRNNVRMLPDARYRPGLLVPEQEPVTGAPLDMSDAFLRGVSQLHIEYLLNMGSQATLTLAITERDRLWGLVACHHRTPRRVSHGVRVVCDLLARVASLQLTDKVQRDEADYRSRIRDAHARIVAAMAAGADPVAMLGEDTAALTQFVACDGVAVVSGADVRAAGKVPPGDHVRRLAALFAASSAGRVLVTDQIATLYPDATQFAESACGVLAVPVAGDGWVLWFRVERARTVRWAGDPAKPVGVGPLGERLTPRKSFDEWIESVRGRSETWTAIEVDSARALATSLQGLTVRRGIELERLNRELARSNRELDAFAYAASHDLKEPLRGIYNYAEFLKRDASERLGADDNKMLDSIVRLATRMRTLVDSLLEFSRFGQVEAVRERVPVGDVVSAVLDSLAVQIEERHAVISVSTELPTLHTVPRFLEQIYANLLTNALKYNDGAGVRIEIGVVRAGESAFPERARGHEFALLVRDDGIGIPARHHDVVFRIFKRLHATDRYGGGSGAGLTIVKRLAERLGGDVWIDPAATRGTTMWFTVERTVGNEDVV